MAVHVYEEMIYMRRRADQHRTLRHPSFLGIF